MTKRQEDIIRNNLNSFKNNFGEVRIESGTHRDFYVYFPSNSDSYMQYCYDVDYLNGWLYGVVQGLRRIEFANAFETNSKI